MLPVLAPDLNYGNLEITDGSVASVAYAKMIRPDTEESERERIRSALYAYCLRDTEGVVRVLGLLRTVG